MHFMIPLDLFSIFHIKVSTQVSDQIFQFISINVMFLSIERKFLLKINMKYV